MPVVRSASNSLDLDDEDQSKYHYRAPSPPRRGTGHKRAQSGATTNATGRHLDVDDARGYDWRSKPAGAGSGLGDAGAEDDDDGDGTGYTQLRLDEDEDEEEIHAATEYLFADAYTGANGAPPGMNDDRPGATPLSQLATTKQLLTEGQKIAYVGLCSLAAKEMVRTLARVPGKETDEAAQSMEGWKLRIMARLYQHMDIEASGESGLFQLVEQSRRYRLNGAECISLCNFVHPIYSTEQSMIDSLAAHGVLSSDLAPALITTQTVPNPDYDPEAAREREEEQREEREKEEEKKREEREEQERERQRVEKEQQEALKHDRKEQEETPATAAEVEQAPPVAEKAEGKEADIGESEDDGDIGMSGEVPPPVYSAKAVERNLATTSKSAGDSSEADGDAGDGDLGAGAGTPTGAAPSTPKLSSVEMEAQPTPKRASVPLADPNTAAQAAADPARDPQNTLGLTSTPQAVEPPPSALEGVTTQISSADESITLDIRWTVLCDLFLVLTADSVYDARSRVLLERVAETLGLSWMDVTKFEKRVTDALEIEEGVESLKDASVMDRRAALAKRKRLVMMGLATVGECFRSCLLPLARRQAF